MVAVVAVVIVVTALAHGDCEKAADDSHPEEKVATPPWSGLGLRSLRGHISPQSFALGLLAGSMAEINRDQLVAAASGLSQSASTAAQQAASRGKMMTGELIASSQKALQHSSNTVAKAASRGKMLTDELIASSQKALQYSSNTVATALHPVASRGKLMTNELIVSTQMAFQNSSNTVTTAASRAKLMTGELVASSQKAFQNTANTTATALRPAADKLAASGQHLLDAVKNDIARLEQMLNALIASGHSWRPPLRSDFPNVTALLHQVVCYGDRTAAELAVAGRRMGRAVQEELRKWLDLLKSQEALMTEALIAAASRLRQFRPEAVQQFCNSTVVASHRLASRGKLMAGELIASASQRRHLRFPVQAESDIISVEEEAPPSQRSSKYGAFVTCVVVLVTLWIVHTRSGRAKTNDKVGVRPREMIFVPVNAGDTNYDRAGARDREMIVVPDDARDATNDEAGAGVRETTFVPVNAGDTTNDRAGLLAREMIVVPDDAGDATNDEAGAGAREIIFVPVNAGDATNGKAGAREMIAVPDDAGDATNDEAGAGAREIIFAPDNAGDTELPAQQTPEQTPVHTHRSTSTMSSTTSSTAAIPNVNHLVQDARRACNRPLVQQRLAEFEARSVSVSTPEVSPGRALYVQGRPRVSSAGSDRA